MGLFDGLQNMMKTNETSQRYYGVILVLLSTIECLTEENIKIFYKKKYNEVCDEIALKKALSKFEAVLEPKQQKTWYSLKEKQRQHEKVETPAITKDEIITICFENYKNEVKSKFEELLLELKSTPEKKKLDEKLAIFDSSLPNSYEYPLEKVAGKAIGEVMRERLLANDPTVIALVIEEVCSHICANRGLERTYALAIRAFHFKESFKTSNEYQSITEDDCYDVVIKAPIYIKKAAELNSSIENFAKGTAKSICRASIMLSGSVFDWRRWAVTDEQFIDAASYYSVQEMAKHFTNSDTTNIESIVNLIASFVARD